MTVGLYFDQNMPDPIMLALRARGVHVLLAREDGMASIADDRLLQRATALGRMLVSHDRGFLHLTSRWRAEGSPFAGLAYVPDGTPYRPVIDDLELIAHAYESADLWNIVIYLPL